MQDKTGPALLPFLFRRCRPPGLASHWGRGPAMSRVLPEGALITHGRSPGPPPSSQRSGTSTCPPGLLVCTPALRPGGPGPSRAITTTGTLQDDRRNLHRTKDEIQDDSDARRLPTVYLLQYPTTVPRDSGENDDDFYAPLMCPAPSCNYKRRRRVSFRLGSELWRSHSGSHSLTSVFKRTFRDY